MFANPNVLILFLLVPLFAGFFVWRNRVRRLAISRIGEPDLINNLAAQVDSKRRLWKSILWLSALGFLIAALARPVWGVEAQATQAEGVSVVVVLDISASMDAEDIAPSRMERAKLDARQIFEQSEGNALGLVLFAGSAFVQFPLTIDSLSAVAFLNAASTASTTEQGTATGEALQTAMGLFDVGNAASSMIVLLTDGENHIGDPLLAAEEAARRGITIHVVGYGSEEGATIPIRDESGAIVDYKTDQAGNLVMTRLDETLLRQIAETSGGLYQRASDSGTEVQNLLDAIDTAESSVLNSRPLVRRVERFELFIALALLALTLEIFLPERRAL